MSSLRKICSELEHGVSNIREHSASVKCLKTSFAFKRKPSPSFLRTSSKERPPAKFAESESVLTALYSKFELIQRFLFEMLG